VRTSSLRRFRPDPLLAAQATPMTDDQRAHPVIQALYRRRDEGSRPGARSDGRRIALVIEGGGMRGVVSAGMAAAIEQLGLTCCFDEVHGASAGAFAAAFLLADQAAYLTGLYPHGFGNPMFASARRMLLERRPVFDLEYVARVVWRAQRPLHTERILRSGIELHCTATDVERAEVVDLTQLADDGEIRAAMLASSRLPWLAGGPVEFRGRRLLDATLAEAIPARVPRASASDLLVLQTRPHGIAHSPLSGPVAWLTDNYLRKLNPALVTLRETRSRRYDQLSAELAAAAADPASTPAVCVIRPPFGTPVIGQMENRADVLAVAGSDGFRAAWMALTGEDADLVRVPRAYPLQRTPSSL
jgi:predicted patatin/cPLA2 family phospholipase